MRLHANARLSPNGRRLLIDRLELDGGDIGDAALAAGISVRTARKWLSRWRAEGELGLLDRSSAPKTVANKTDARTVELIAALRRLRLSGPQIAELIDRPLSTVCAVLKRIGMGRLGRLGMEPAVRYERSRPGELIHTDIKKLGRIAGGAGKRATGGISRNQRSKVTDDAGVRRQITGWDCVHIAIDDATRLAYAEVLADEKAETAVAFLQRAIEFFARHGIRCERVITDNGSPYVSRAHAIACRQLGLRHLRTRPYRPQTNGKAERFIRTMLREWAYAGVYGSSPERAAALSGWLERYNFSRRHGALGHRPPIERLRELQGNNVAGIYN
jgi:transposase InsO family protein